MSDAATYSKIESLRSGQRVEIRALKPDDRDALVAAVGRTSAQSLYRRFLGAKRDFSEREIAFFMHPDFVDHVALVAVVEEGGDHPSWPGHATLSFSPAARRWPSR